MTGNHTALRARVLVVEDDAGVRVALVANLEAEGYEVAEASDGGEALELMVEQRFSLVISDGDMPRANGLEVLKGLKSVSPETPLILVSAALSERTLRAAVNEGLYAAFDKPVLMRAVLDAVRRALERRPLLVAGSGDPDLDSVADGLRVLGMPVATVLNSEEALDFVERQRAEACILNLSLPSPPGGDEVWRALKKADSDMPVVGITTTKELELVRAILREGVTACLSKPLDRSLLLLTLVKTRGALRSDR